MQTTAQQKQIVENIITLHETGKLSNKSYGTLVNVRGDPGGLTYGKHQVTINSGGLYLMLNRYCNNPQANPRLVSVIRGYLLAIRAKQINIASSPKLRDALVEAGNDPAMMATQDKYFDDQYWNPAVKFCEARGLNSALAMAVVYDSTVHGSLYRIDKRVPKSLPEPQWVITYVNARRNWLANHSIMILRRCLYRMDTFLRLIKENNFDLHPPVWAHGKRADIGIEAVAIRPTRIPEEELVPLGATTQRIMDRGDKGSDVVELQHMLIRIGYHTVTADGDFGPRTEAAVVAFQRLYGLVADGIVGPSTWRTLDQVDD